MRSSVSSPVILNEGTPDQVQITVVQNVGESEVSGLELNYAWQVTDRWFMSANYALADTDITEGTDTTQGGILGDQFDLNVRANFANENFDITLWASNLLDDDAVSNVFRYVDPGDFRFFRRAYVSFLSPGRQTGVSFRYKF